MKILHYIRNLDLGGTSKTCELFFKHSSDYFDSAVAYEKSGDHTRLEQFEDAAEHCGGKLFEIDSYSTSNPSTSELQTLIDTEGVDILHVYRSGFPEFPEPGVDINVPHFVETNVFGSINVNSKIDRTLFMSKWLMDYALRGFPLHQGDSWLRRMRFVNNPVERPATKDLLPLFPALSDKTILLGRCGRPDNGIYNAVSVNAAAILITEGYDIRFLVVAPPSNMVDDLCRLNIPYYNIPSTTDPIALSQFYNTIDIYAHARADGETFGVNIAEAMMHGKPVVTHIATPSHPGMGVFQSQTELVDDGITGYVVNNDVGAYSRALKTLIDSSDIRDRFGANGRDKAQKEYHVSHCVRKLEEIYSEVYSN